MRALLGDNMCNGSIQKVETNPFARADLEHLLAMVDDDMKLEALPQTNYIKTIVTAEILYDGRVPNIVGMNKARGISAIPLIW